MAIYPAKKGLQCQQTPTGYMGKHKHRSCRAVLGAYLSRHCLLFKCVAKWRAKPSRVVPTEVPKVGVTGAPNDCNCCCGWCSWFGVVVVVCMDIYGSCLVSSLVNCPYINRSYWNNKQHKKLSVIYQSISNNSTQLNSTSLHSRRGPTQLSAYRSRLSRQCREGRKRERGKGTLC